MTILKILALATLIVISVFLILDGISIWFAVRNAMKKKVEYSKTLSAEFLCLFLWGICFAILILT